MAKRCEHCRFWKDTVFKGESASGWGVWWGDCRNPRAPGSWEERRHSLMLACDEFERRPECGCEPKGKVCLAGACTAPSLSRGGEK